MQLYDVLSGAKYTKNGKEKTQWSQIGTIFKRDDGSLSGKMASIPLNWDGQFIVKEREAREL
jgi:hypothetical protein